ncbi:MAG: hydroxymethylbilane synthase, partial [Bacteroidota bacterium]
RSVLLRHFPGLNIGLVVIKTLGDKILDSPLSAIGDKGLFTKEIENALLDGRIDIAVHSLKDIPTRVPDGLTIPAITEREDVRDVFIAHPGKPGLRLSDLPDGASVATGSLRRKCQLLALRPDVQVVDIRGNLNTRLEKLGESDWHGMILAKAGLTRLGFSDRITEVLPFDVMLPAVGQGALGVEIRSDDRKATDLVRCLHHEETAVAVRGERALLRFLEGGCQVPIGTYGRVEDRTFRLDALIGSLDGRRIVRGSIAGSPHDSEALGTELAKELLDRGGKGILEEIRSALPGTEPGDI